uniref:CDR ABC transporter domain-containing protein n=1 Tax=Megaselia scalaris TaxID=36166 RepID=T1GFW2_MEGSC
MLYANEAMTVAQWRGVENITCFQESTELPCLANGKDVLDKYSFSEGRVYTDIFSIVVIYFIFHLLAYFCLWRKARRI